MNVVSWNRLAAFMLASGGDDGALRVWDLRNFAAGEHVASFAYHRSGARPPHPSVAFTNGHGAAGISIAEHVCVRVEHGASPDVPATEL